MNAARRAARAGRNLLIALVVGALILVAIVVAYMTGRTTAGPTSTPSGVTGTAGQSGSTDGVPDTAPTGCLGGPKQNTAMLLAAQSQAAGTSFGAVEVAAAFFRWTYRYPHPSNRDIDQAQALFVPARAVEAERNLIAAYKRSPNPSNGVVANGTDFHLSTVGAQWTVTAGPGEGQERVSIRAPFVIDDAISPTRTATGAFDLKLQDGKWRIVGLAEADSSKLAAGGTSFTAGC